MRNKQNLLISIKPEWATLILNNMKSIEVRKLPELEQVEKIFFYVSGTIKKILFYVEKPILRYESSWDFTDEDLDKSCLSQRELIDYCHDRIQRLTLIDVSKINKIYVDPKAIFENFKAPQNFKYLTETESKLILEGR